MRSKVKATHKGECQFCKKIHKIPSGKITKHGYTVVESNFAGVCLGSGLLPYNLSCEDITTVLIPQIEKTATRLKMQTNKVKTDVTNCWQRVYDSETRFHYWVEGIIKEKENHGWQGRHFEFVYDGTKSIPVEGYHLIDLDEITIQAITRMFNSIFAKHLEKQLKECDQLLDSAQNRVKNWEQKPLLLIES